MGVFSATPAASEYCLDKQFTLKSLNGAAPPNSLNRGAKLVQTERNTKWKAKFFIFIVEVLPNLSKGSEKFSVISS